MIVRNLETNQVTEQEIRLPSAQEIVWIHLLRPTPSEVQQVVGDLFGCHPLVVEDCTKLNQRPKMDRYKDHIFLTFFAVVDKKLTHVEIGIVIGANFLITITKQPLGFIDDLRRELLAVTERTEHPGLMLHRLLDHCVDGYTDVTDHIEDLVDQLERRVFHNPYLHVSKDVFQHKRAIHKLRRIIAEEKTIIGSITHHTFPYTRAETDVYFIDVYDHLSRVVDSLDTFRESFSGLLELQMNMKSDRMNEIMKTLTIISSIFLPLTFVVGLYGMNFKDIPELNWSFGYAYVWVVLIAVSVVMWLIFKWKKWI
ncbi:magnesium/cobalt transporter CorA [Paenibacillus doosanensis]|uniref:Magnesium transport protein CorA n=1 Tax=Paenibacillus konkukensis TaxID=2020716 RepID=A0ABY4RN83_9BACL|nr:MULTISPECIES: magnesium/cobalt transporter CorA [Paenibacillus]MCS7464074.1 magnesium/cobalt transporter CorA [Paenibacillus doosanensis]UQZ83934.1 Magnesium transport protein CorA [Paenibacillus konkukensis]